MTDGEISPMSIRKVLGGDDVKVSDRLHTNTRKIKALKWSYFNGLGGTSTVIYPVLFVLCSLIFFYLPYNHNPGGDK